MWKELGNGSTGPFGIPSKIMKGLKEDFDEIVGASSEQVKEYFRIQKSKAQLDKLTEENEELSEQLDKLSGFALPWSKKARKKRELKRKIAGNNNTIRSLNTSLLTKSLSLATEEDRETVAETETMIRYVLNKEYSDLDGCNNELADLYKFEKELFFPIERRDSSLAEKLGITTTKTNEIRAEIAKRRQLLEARKREIIMSANSTFPEYVNKNRLAA